MITMNRSGKLTCAVVFALLTLVLIALVKFVDVAAIGPEATRIGLSHLNGFVHEKTGVNMLFYKVTEVLGILSILVAAAFAVTGGVQLIRRRSIAKVDKEIFALGGLYVAVVALYVLFEKVIINYRPIIMPGAEHPEASFPSSHTMLVIAIMGSTIIVLRKYVRGKGARAALQALCWIVMLATVAGRLLSGVHWLTDILGGIFISAALLSVFAAVIEEIRRRARRAARARKARRNREN